LGFTLGEFSPNPSGHPGQERKETTFLSCLQELNAFLNGFCNVSNDNRFCINFLSSPRPVFCCAPDQGCQIFIGITYQHEKNLPNDHKTYQMEANCAK
jgi:hypothetical protein